MLKIIVADDEKLLLRQFKMEIENIPGVNIVGMFLRTDDVLEFSREHQYQVAFLDIEMPGMSGLELGKKLRQLYPDLVIIFITAHEKYVIDALRIKADYYITKPYSSEDIKEAIERAKLLSIRQRQRIFMKTFGRFDVFIDGKNIDFSNAKAKELLALCVDHIGGTVSMEEAIDKLWESRAYDSRAKNLYRKSVMYLKKKFEEVGEEGVFISRRGECRIDTEKIECDYYDLLDQKEPALKMWRTQGSYMENYSWAEETNARISAIYEGEK